MNHMEDDKPLLKIKASYPDPEKYPDPTQEPFNETCDRFGIRPPGPGEDPLSWALSQDDDLPEDISKKI